MRKRFHDSELGESSNGSSSSKQPRSVKYSTNSIGGSISVTRIFKTSAALEDSEDTDEEEKMCMSNNEHKSSSSRKDDLPTSYGRAFTLNIKETSKHNTNPSSSRRDDLTAPIEVTISKDEEEKMCMNNNEHKSSSSRKDDLPTSYGRAFTLKIKERSKHNINPFSSRRDDLTSPIGVTISKHKNKEMHRRDDLPMPINQTIYTVDAFVVNNSDYDRDRKCYNRVFQVYQYKMLRIFQARKDEIFDPLIIEKRYYPTPLYSSYVFEHSSQLQVIKAKCTKEKGTIQYVVLLQDADDLASFMINI